MVSRRWRVGRPEWSPSVARAERRVPDPARPVDSSGCGRPGRGRLFAESRSDFVKNWLCETAGMGLYGDWLVERVSWASALRVGGVCVVERGRVEGRGGRVRGGWRDAGSDLGTLVRQTGALRFRRTRKEDGVEPRCMAFTGLGTKAGRMWKASRVRVDVGS